MFRFNVIYLLFGSVLSFPAIAEIVDVYAVTLNRTHYVVRSEKGHANAPLQWYLCDQQEHAIAGLCNVNINLPKITASICSADGDAVTFAVHGCYVAPNIPLMQPDLSSHHTNGSK